MPDSFFGPNPEQFAQLFPFHLAFDTALTVRQIGHALQRITPGLSLGASVPAFFELRRPALEWTVEALRDQDRATFLVASTTSALELKGQMAWLPEAGLMLFLGSPWSTNIAALSALGITLNDFPPHALTGDFLFMLQSQRTTLDEVHKLTSRLTRQRAELRASEQQYRTLIENLQSVFFQADPDQRWVFLNQAWSRLTDWTVEESLGTPLIDHIHPADRQEAQARIDRMLADPADAIQHQLRLRTRSGRECWVDLSMYVMEGGAGLAGTMTDITLHHQEQAARTRLQEELIQVQASMLEQLSSPLIELQRGTLVLPLIGMIDHHRAERITSTLLSGVGEHRSHTVIIDITGVPVVDTLVANTLIQATQAVRLLGAQIILTGVRPEVAQTLVGLGVALDTLVTAPSLEQGMLLARRHGASR